MIFQENLPSMAIRAAQETKTRANVNVQIRALGFDILCK